MAHEHSAELQNLPAVTVSGQTIRNRIPEAGLHFYRSIKLFALCCCYREAHLGWWAEEYAVVKQHGPKFCSSTNVDLDMIVKERECVVQRETWGGAGISKKSTITKFLRWAVIDLHHRLDLVCLEGAINKRRNNDQVQVRVVQTYSYARGSNLVYVGTIHKSTLHIGHIIGCPSAMAYSISLPQPYWACVGYAAEIFNLVKTDIQGRPTFENILREQ